jgi:hypothetical protein
MSTELVAAEVENLHRFIERWFNGTVPKTIDSFARLSSSWREGFTLIDPHNKSHSSQELLESTYELHGKFPRLSIQIKGISISCRLPCVAIAVYEEWHIEPHETEARLCSAMFSFEASHPGSAKWVHIHESKLAL